MAVIVQCGVTYEITGEACFTLVSTYGGPNPLPHQMWIGLEHVRAEHGARISNLGSTGVLYIEYGDNADVLINPGRSAVYNYASLRWELLQFTDSTANYAKVCTCGVKFSGGLCSDWCDLVRLVNS